MENVEKKFGINNLCRGFVSSFVTGLGLEVAGELYSYAKNRVKALTEKKRIAVTESES